MYKRLIRLIEPEQVSLFEIEKKLSVNSKTESPTM